MQVKGQFGEAGFNCSRSPLEAPKYVDLGTGRRIDDEQEGK